MRSKTERCWSFNSEEYINYYYPLPDDDVHLRDIKVLEHIVYTSTTFAEVKNRMIAYSNSMIIGLDNTSIDKLFTYNEN